MISVRHPHIRRFLQSPTVCRRAALRPCGCSPALDPWFLRRLAHFDRELELYWNGALRFWTLYRLARRGITPASDRLVKELDIRGPRGEYRPVGDWLLDDLRARRLEHLEPEPSRQLDAEIRLIEQENEKREEELRKEELALREESNAAFGYCARGHAGELSAASDFRRRSRPKPGTKRVAGPEAPLRRW